jgi:geranylgeranyl diphosphate synthase, type II
MMPSNTTQTRRPEVSALERAYEAREKIERRLVTAIQGSPGAPGNLLAAIEHALIAPSKRIRPMLVYLVAEPEEDNDAAALDLGCAIEMVHTASLILDDLPSMDDAKVRRDRPTTHIVFGESTAILSAIALLTRAFGLVAELDAPPAVRTALAAILADAVGYNGLVAGQEIDLNERARLVDPEAVENLNWLKTGTLFVAAAEMAAILRGLPTEKTQSVRTFARHLGLAFQTADDIADKTGTMQELGKDVLKDADKASLVTIFGAKLAQLNCDQHLEAAEAALRDSGVTAPPITALIDRLIKKKQRGDGG